jgi:L-2-hydroxyglutarate oxidase
MKKLKAEEISAYEPHVRGAVAVFVPQTGIIDYQRVGQQLAEEIGNYPNAQLLTGFRVLKVTETTGQVLVQTPAGEFGAKLFINTCGLFSDRVALTTMEKLPVRIIPFRGEYYKLRQDKEYLVKNLVYPVPDPQFPFLGVHFTRMMKGGVEAGPNAVLAFKREGYKKTDFSVSDTIDTFAWKGFRKVMWQYAGMGAGEFYRSFSKTAFTKALQRLLPEIRQEDLVPGGAGIRAQACDRNGNLVDDFLFAEGNRCIHVLNAPSPAATACLAIGEYVAGKAMRM